MAAAMTEMLGARGVSFLIADFSGWSLSRLGHVDADGEPGSRSRETSERVLLDGSDRKSTRLNSSHVEISYAVFCLKKKKEYRERKHQHQHATTHSAQEM